MTYSSSGSSGKWEGWFPFPEYRAHQEETLCKVVEAHKRVPVVLLQGPVGFGKSPLAIALAKFYKTAFLATIQRQLQDQYYKDFPEHLAILKGKNNYACEKDWRDDDNRKLNYTCHLAPCGLNLPSKKDVSKGCEAEGICTYINTRNYALKQAPITLMNFTNLLLFSMKKLPKRELVVFDECHLLKQQLYSFAEIAFTPKAFSAARKVLNPEETELLERGFPDLRTVVEFCKELTPRIDALLKRGAVTDKEEAEFVRLAEQVEKMQMFQEGLHEELEYVIRKEQRGSTISPLEVSHMGHLALKAGTKALLMSGTILDAELMAKSLGITNYEYIEVPSTFPPENRPTISIPVGSMSYAKQEETFPELVKYIRAILRKHKDEKGIIQTYTYSIAEKLQRELGGDARLLFQTRDIDKQLLFHEHCDSAEPTVLVGPGFKEGVDLFGDRATFQILCKLPCPDMKDPVIAGLMKKDKRLYDLQIAMDIQQMLGRVTRSKTDKAVNYILDGYFPLFYSRNKHLFTKDVRETIVLS